MAAGFGKRYNRTCWHTANMAMHIDGGEKCWCAGSGTSLDALLYSSKSANLQMSNTGGLLLTPLTHSHRRHRFWLDCLPWTPSINTWVTHSFTSRLIFIDFVCQFEGGVGCSIAYISLHKKEAYEYKSTASACLCIYATHYAIHNVMRICACCIYNTIHALPRTTGAQPLSSPWQKLLEQFSDTEALSWKQAAKARKI